MPKVKQDSRAPVGRPAAWYEGFTRLLLSAEKPSSEDYVRGCHMASYQSDSFKDRYDPASKDDIRRMDADILNLLSAKLGPGEDGWTWTLVGIRDGDVETLVDDGSTYWGAPDGLPEWVEELRSAAETMKSEAERAEREREDAESNTREDNELRFAIARGIDRRGATRVRNMVDELALADTRRVVNA